MGDETTPPLEDLENKFQALVGRHPVPVAVIIVCCVLIGIGLGIAILQRLGW